MGISNNIINSPYIFDVLEDASATGVPTKQLERQ